MRARPSAFGMPVSRTAGGKQNALKEGAFGYNLPNKNSATIGKSIAFQEGFAIIWKSHKEKPPSQREVARRSRDGRSYAFGSFRTTTA